MEVHKHPPATKTDSQNLLVVPGRQKLQRKFSHKTPEDPNKGLSMPQQKFFTAKQRNPARKPQKTGVSSVCEAACHPYSEKTADKMWWICFF